MRLINFNNIFYWNQYIQNVVILKCNQYTQITTEISRSLRGSKSSKYAVYLFIYFLLTVYLHLD